MKKYIENLLQDAIRNQDSLKKQTYRSLIADITTAEKNGNNDEISIIIKANKKRLDAAEIYKKAGRTELYEKEMLESHLISGLLPAEPTEEEIKDRIAECCGNVSTDRKRIMEYVKDNHPTVNGKLLFTLVNEHLKTIK